jgi:hypothetical protein
MAVEGDNVEPVVDPVVDPANPPVDPPKDPPVVAASGDEPKEPTKEPVKVTEPKPVNSAFAEKKLLERVNKLTAQKKELEAKLAAQSANPAPKADDPEEIQRQIDAKAEQLANAKADQIAAAREFNAKSNEVVTAGREAYTKEVFDGAVNSLKQLITPEDPSTVQKHYDLIAGLIETGEAPRLIVELGKDLELADKIMNLSPLKMGIELAKLAAAKPEEVSKAPKPITPIGRQSASHVKIEPGDKDRADNLSTAEWMARRQADIMARRAAGERVM